MDCAGQLFNTRYAGNFERPNMHDEVFDMVVDLNKRYLQVGQARWRQGRLPLLRALVLAEAGRWLGGLGRGAAAGRRGVGSLVAGLALERLPLALGWRLEAWRAGPAGQRGRPRPAAGGETARRLAG
jgi:hypothetical protein